MHILITAGPTREPLDPVRYLSNRSSGRMGFALAEAAVRAGHTVTLLAGPVSIPAPAGIRRVDVMTAADMYAAVRSHLGPADVAIFAAAVADYAPVAPAARKIKKAEETLTLELKRTPDILGSVRRDFGWHGFLAGFAAETDHVLDHAMAKLQSKDCDLIVANDVSLPGAGFDSTNNAATLLFKTGEVRPLPLMTKAELAQIIVAECTRGGGLAQIVSR